MKKIALLLAFIISTAMFTACSDKGSSDAKSSSSSQIQKDESSDSSDSQESNDSSQKSADSSQEDNSLSDTSDENNSQNPVKDESTQNSSASQEQPGTAGFARGTVKDGVYTNEFASLRFTAPQGWEFANDEYIATMMNISLDVTDNNNDLTKAILEQTTIYDAVCTEQATGKNIIIMYENIAKSVPNPDTFTVENYMDIVDKQFSSTSGMAYNKDGERTKVSINGKEYIKQVYTVTYEEMNFTTQQVYYVRKVGNMMLGIIMSSGLEESDMSVYEKNFEE